MRRRKRRRRRRRTRRRKKKKRKKRRRRRRRGRERDVLPFFAVLGLSLKRRPSSTTRRRGSAR